MLDLSRINRELDSPLYGSVSHVSSVLMRVVNAGAVVAKCSGDQGMPGVVYVGIGQGLGGEQRHQLYAWPNDPDSYYWHPGPMPFQDRACVLAPSCANDALACREIAGMLGMSEAESDHRCLCLYLATPPGCRILFVRGSDQPPFDEQDPQRLLRYTAKCGRIIREGYVRALNNPSDSDAPIPLCAPTSTVEQLITRLSKTEQIVLNHLHRMRTERQIAQIMSRSPNTVHVHVKNIYRKLRVNSRKQLRDMIDATLQRAIPDAHESTSRAQSA